MSLSSFQTGACRLFKVNFTLSHKGAGPLQSPSQALGVRAPLTSEDFRPTQLRSGLSKAVLRFSSFCYLGRLSGSVSCSSCSFVLFLKKQRHLFFFFFFSLFYFILFPPSLFMPPTPSSTPPHTFTTLLSLYISSFSFSLFLFCSIPSPHPITPAPTRAVCLLSVRQYSRAAWRQGLFCPHCNSSP